MNKEKLAQEASQLQHANDRSFSAWLWTYGSTLFSTFAIVGSGIFAFVKWRGDRRKEHENEQKERENEQQKQEKERFESLSSVITGLQDEKVGTRVAAAIMLRMVFLRPGYEQFYEQVFALAVDNLRIRYTDPDTPEPINTLCRTLVIVFTKAFVLSRDRLIQENPGFSAQSLDAMQIQLNNMYLANVDLRQAWMPKSNLSKANLGEANLSGADLSGADLTGANLWRTELIGANLWGVHLERVNLERANLEGASLVGAGLDGAILKGANLKGAILESAGLKEANLEGANLEEADLTTATLTKSNPEAAASLKGTKLSSVFGLTASQRRACAHAGAIFGSIYQSSTSATSSSSSSPPFAQSNDTQTPSVISGQESTPTPDTDGSSAASS